MPAQGKGLTTGPSGPPNSGSTAPPLPLLQSGPSQLRQQRGHLKEKGLLQDGGSASSGPPLRGQAWLLSPLPLCAAHLTSFHVVAAGNMPQPHSIPAWNVLTVPPDATDPRSVTCERPPDPRPVIPSALTPRPTQSQWVL